MMTVYLDNAATTKPGKAALDAFAETAERFYGNPSSSHLPGREARAMLEEARARVASAIGATSTPVTSAESDSVIISDSFVRSDAAGVSCDRIVFTSGGTESVNLAIQGACAARPEKRKIIISSVEHPSVFKTCSMLGRRGYEVVKVPVSLDGSIDEDWLRSAVDDDTAIVSFMMVNNETGTILPVSRIAEIVKSKNPDVPVHTDAVQALGKIPVDVSGLGVDLLSISAHKIHGLKGIGALFVRGACSTDKAMNTDIQHTIHPIMRGGDQELGLRPGTEATPLIAAFAAAAEEAIAELPLVSGHIGILREYLMQGLSSLNAGPSNPTVFSQSTVSSEPTTSQHNVQVNTIAGGSPYIVNFSMPNHDPDQVVAFLSDRGIYISRGAACRSNHERGPSMLMSFGLPAEIADTALRVSMSHENTIDDIDALLSALEGLLTHR